MKTRIRISLMILSLGLGLFGWQLLRPTETVNAAMMLPQVITVINTDDNGPGSLRQALADAANGDTITFSLSGCPCTITLTTGELVINKNLTITGPGASLLTISGNNASRVFFINPGASGATTGPPATALTVSISHLTIANGKAKGGNGGGIGVPSSGYGGGGGGGAGLGGGIFVNNGNLTTDNVAFTGNQAIGGDGSRNNVNGYGNGTGGGGAFLNGGNSTTWYDVGTPGGGGGNLGGLGNGDEGGGGSGGGDSSLGGNGGFGGGGGGGGANASANGNAASGGNGGFGGGGGGGGGSYAAVPGLGGLGGMFGGKGRDGYQLQCTCGSGGGGGGGGLGGAIFIRAGALSINNTQFTSNQAVGGAGGGGEGGQGKGGAVFIYTGATANSCGVTYTSNSATDAAGSGTDTNDYYGSIVKCNIPPTITAAAGVTRLAGAVGSSSQIATVNDAEDAENTLAVTATALTGSGVTLSNISTDGTGKVTATVTANCTATTSTFTLRVTDSGTLSATATLTVTVNANQPPTLSYPSNPGTSYGTGITVNPLTGPSDDLGVTSVVVQSITPSNPGGITVDSSGVVSVANNVPAGMYTVTIRANAACSNKDASFTLGIVKATPTITWNNPADIVYGTALSVTQLNAMANVPGTFSYSPASGTVLNAGNGQTLSATFTPNDTNNYSTATKNVSINVLKATPFLTWNNPADIIYGTPLGTTQLSAMTNVPGTFSYNPASGTVLNAGNGQLLAVNFTPTDTSNYTTANKSVAINVLKATPPITWATPAFLLSGPLSAAALNATTNVAGMFSYSPSAGTVLAAGSVTLTANFTPSDSGNYNPASLSVTLPVLDSVCSITVNPATMPAATRGTPFVQTLSASPTGSYVFSVLSGSLPPGVNLVNTLGIYSLRGTPTASGSYTFTIKARKNNSTCEGARTYTIVVP